MRGRTRGVGPAREPRFRRKPESNRHTASHGPRLQTNDIIVSIGELEVLRADEERFEAATLTRLVLEAYWERGFLLGALEYHAPRCLHDFPTTFPCLVSPLRVTGREADATPDIPLTLVPLRPARAFVQVNSMPVAPVWYFS
jgi:hypothetical protein